MKIAVLGTGMVGDSIGTKLISLGHEVMMGSRTEKNEKAVAWQKKAGAKATVGTFSQAAKFGELVFNCTQGVHSIEVLKSAGVDNLKNKILIDISNALDFSKGMPPTLAICNTESLAEKIQAEFPETKVVKTLNTLNCQLMVEPGKLKGDHDLFMSGNDKDAKQKVLELLKSFGWKSVIDLGDITTARGTEMLMPIWLRLWGALGTADFNFKIIKN
jgi:predicted dinucleotide-binding enzyme